MVTPMSETVAQYFLLQNPVLITSNVAKLFCQQSKIFHAISFKRQVLSLLIANRGGRQMRS